MRGYFTKNIFYVDKSAVKVYIKILRKVKIINVLL